MDTERIDVLARRVHRDLTRRDALVALVGTLVARVQPETVEAQTLLPLGAACTSVDQRARLSSCRGDGPVSCASDGFDDDGARNRSTREAAGDDVAAPPYVRRPYGSM